MIVLQTAVFALRQLDPTRDVVVFLVKVSDKENAIIATLKAEFVKLGAVVIERPVLPMRNVDKQMYYRFDWQKMYVWNLPHTRVMFLDSDMVVMSSPAQGFALCPARRPVCAVQEIRTYGGYFNNGFFVLNKFAPWNNEMEKLLRAWWKPNAPWRQICLQDLMNEVYAK